MPPLLKILKDRLQKVTKRTKVGEPAASGVMKNFHRATRSTTQTNDPLNFEDNEGNPVTVPGGTQTLEVQTEGWAYLFGGGIEGWVSPRFALFGDGSFYKLKGEAKSGTDIPIDGHVFTVVAGIRLKVF